MRSAEEVCAKRRIRAPGLEQAIGLLDDSWSGNGHYHEIRAASPVRCLTSERRPRFADSTSAPRRSGQRERAARQSYRWRQPVRRAPHQHGEHEADGALAQHHHELIRLRIGLHNSFEAGVQRLDQCGALKRNAVRYLLHPSFATIQSITRTYCAKPPPAGSNPAVIPTFL